MNRALFPLGKAYGKAFCNRVEETRLLVGNIQNGKHTLLIAPRRYGKSSLAERAIQQASFPSEKANFHLCTSEEEVALLIKKICLSMISTHIGKLNVLLPKISQYLKTLTPRVSFFKNAASVELISQEKENYALTISETLIMLDKILKDHDKRGVLFFDEFQEICHIKKSTHLEGAIRTAAQETTNLSIIFSGSIRSLLLGMFENEARPLYKLCRKIHLRKIDAEDYAQHIQNIALDTWGKTLPDNILQSIFTLSNLHPYYINYLCDCVWQNAEKLPTEELVHKSWEQVLSEEWSDAVREISLLSIAQRKILKYLANENINSNLTSQQTAISVNLAPSTISSVLTALVEKDYIELDGECYSIINPLLKAALTQ